MHKSDWYILLPYILHKQVHRHNWKMQFVSVQSGTVILQTVLHMQPSFLPVLLFPVYISDQEVLPVRLCLHISPDFLYHNHTSAVYILLLSKVQKDFLHSSSSGTMHHFHLFHTDTEYAVSWIHTVCHVLFPLFQDRSVSAEFLLLLMQYRF